MRSILYRYKKWRITMYGKILQDSNDSERRKKATRKLEKIRFKESEYLLERRVLEMVKKDGYHYLVNRYEFDKTYKSFFEKHKTLKGI